MKDGTPAGRIPHRRFSTCRVLGPTERRMWSPILAPRSRQQAAAEIARSCRELFRARGGVTAADPEALIRELRTQDTTIRFPRNVQDVPGFGGVRPPRDSMPPRSEELTSEPPSRQY